MRHAVIMAGGAGTRLWPLSRKQRPKHFLKLIEGKSLMRIAFERLAACLPATNINVITSAGHLDLVAQELPELPRENLIGEPAVRDTANAVGLSSVILHQRDPDGTMGIFTADHIIRPVNAFKAALDRAYRTAEQHGDALITMGVTPASPHTGYGYIHRGDELADGVYRVKQFVEKPDPPTAAQYVASGEYYWNSGMFVWQTQTILAQLQQHLPENYATLMRVGQVDSLDRRRALIGEIYPHLHKTSIDYGVMEKARQVIICELGCQWLDIGSWTSLEDIVSPDTDGQVLAHSKVVSLDSKNNIYAGEGDQLIATIGVQDLVIVRSESATLVCHKDQVQKIKDLVAKLDEAYL